MTNFSTLTARIDYNIVQGKKNPVYLNAYNLPQPETVVGFKHVLLECLFHGSGGVNPTGITISLWRPRKFFVENNVQHLIDKWGDSSNAIPPHKYSHPRAVELRRDTADASFELEQWVRKYWEAVPGSHDTSDGRIEQGWPGFRHAHSVYPRSLLGERMAGESGTDDDWARGREWTLRVTAALDDLPAEKYCVLVTMYRGNRTAKKAFTFSIIGKITGHDFFEAEYIPIAIVYSPPGQDMTNSLIEAETHGTRFTFGFSAMSGEASGMGTIVKASGGYGFVGINSEWEETSESQIMGTDSSSSTIRIMTTQETMITANNQRAIGRAYWGPLGDLFVIIKDFLFHVGEVFDEESGYILQPLPDSPRARKLIFSAHELLRPDPGSVADQIPWGQRKSILRLDPFIVRDDSVLDEVGDGTRPLEDAVDPDADPNAGDNPTRAVKVLSLDLGRGSEINFYESTEVMIDKVEAHAVTYETTFSHAGNIGIYYGIYGNIGLGQEAQFTGQQRIYYQTTSELRQETAKTRTAKCYLTRNQKDRASEVIDVYYDTVFGTFLFRQIPQENGCVSIFGTVLNRAQIGIEGVPVALGAFVNEEIEILAKTATTNTGTYFFPCIPFIPDAIYGLGILDVDDSGDVTMRFDEIKDMTIAKGWIIHHINNAIKILEPSKSRYIDFMEAFDLAPNEAQKLSKIIMDFQSEDELYRYLGIPSRRLKEIKKYYRFVPSKRRSRVKKEHKPIEK